jgi:hypothetical protein
VSDLGVHRRRLGKTVIEGFECLSGPGHVVRDGSEAWPGGVVMVRCSQAFSPHAIICKRTSSHEPLLHDTS